MRDDAANPTRARGAWHSGRLLAILAFGGGLVACGIKGPDVFEPQLGDAPPPGDINAPVFSNFLPSATVTGPVKANSFLFDLLDGTSTNGATATGLDATTVRASLSPSGTAIALTQNANRFTGSLAGIADGMLDIRLSGKDKAGNEGTSSVAFWLKRTAPQIVFDQTPPATWQSPAASVDFRFAGRITDPFLANASGRVVRPGPDNACNTSDDVLVAKGTGGGQVSENSFTYVGGTFDITFKSFNGVLAGGQASLAPYCLVVTASDLAKDETGAASPNTSRAFFQTNLTWQPPVIPTGAIVGRVTAGTTPVAGITVTAGTRTTTTGADGRYRFDPIESGSYTVTISGIPTGLTCTPTSKTAVVTALTETTVDFSCTAAPAFVLNLTGSYLHFTGFSRVCFRLVSTPAQPNAAYTGTITGPPGGVSGNGQKSGTLDAAGTATIPNDIFLFGTYSGTFSVGTVQASGSISVTGTAGTGTC